MNLLLLDTETTGLEVQDRLIQIAWKAKKIDGHNNVDKTFSAYFKPNCQISFEAMSVNHITNEMVLDKPTFQDSEDKKILEELSKDHILVAHNAKFDAGMLEKEGIYFKVWIDSKRVAQHLIDSKRYNLQFLRYSLGLNSDAMAHDAVGDVMVLEKLFTFMFNKIAQDLKESSAERIVDHMVTLSNRPVLLRRFAFGKHKDKTFKEVASYARDYLVWLWNAEMGKVESERDEDLVFTLKQYLNHNQNNEFFPHE